MLHKTVGAGIGPEAPPPYVTRAQLSKKSSIVIGFGIAGATAGRALRHRANLRSGTNFLAFAPDGSDAQDCRSPAGLLMRSTRFWSGHGTPGCDPRRIGVHR